MLPTRLIAITRRRSFGPSAWLLLALSLTALTGSDYSSVTAQGGGSCTPPTGNPIVCENALPGNLPSEWDIVGAGDPSIQGFATDISVNRGQTVRFKVATNASNYRLDIYRLGYYNGLGARRITTVNPSVSLPQNQPNCLSDATTGLVDCGNWAQSASWLVPSTATSGVYIAKLVRPDTGGASHIVFIVRDDSGQSDVLFQTSDPTWQAYNSYGGNSLYTGSPAGRAYKVSYNRPFITRGDFGGLGMRSFLFNAEYPMIRWLEANGYNVSYSTGVDSDRRGAEILEHKVFLSVGHDEYWSAGQRANVEAARNAGVNLAFLSGNEVFWKTRWENSIDGSGTSHRTLVTYKETLAGNKSDPLPNVWTGTWRDPRFSPPADGNRPENALTGTSFIANDRRYDPMTVPQPYGRLRFWRNTSVATLPAGGVANFAAGILGHEWDEDPDNGSRPAGLIHLSSTTLNIHAKLLDFGSQYGAGTATHNLTLYRHSSGALVFGAGTVQWSWALDANHDLVHMGSSEPDVRIQQATVNFLADMSAQPLTLQAGLVLATKSTDLTRPTATITFPTNGASLESGKPITIRGNVTDGGGGVVAGVEVSVDGGLTWKRAPLGTGNWTFAWTPGPTGSVSIRARAIDDSANLQTSVATVTATVTPDVNGPVISGVQASAIMSTWATITWTTDELSDSQVEYGLTTAYGSATNVQTTRVTSHSVIVTGLTPDTLYRYRVASRDAAGRRTLSSGFSFRTATADATQTITFDDRPGENQDLTGSYPDGLINWGAAGWYHSGPMGQMATKNLTFMWGYTSASFTFATQMRLLTLDAYNREPSPATVTVSCPRQPSAQVTIPGETLVTIATGWTTSCSPVTLSATNAGGTLFDNLVVDSPPDLLEPLISGIAASTTAVTAMVTWTTDEPADTQVQFGLTTAYGSSSPLDPAPRTTHAVLLTGLTPNTLYHYRVLSRDPAGNLATSSDVSFTTGPPDTTAPVLGNIRAVVLGADRATIVWTTNEISDSRVDFGATASYGSTTGVDPALTTTHSLVLTGLQPETLYHYSVLSRDPSGNLATSADFTFTTGAPRGCPCSIWNDAALPSVPYQAETRAVELGLKFRASAEGSITAIRFYKGAGNTGTHVGNLWTSTGELLSSVTFTGETAVGWQQATLPAPVPITPGATYVVSYHSSSGFAVDVDYFDQRFGVENAPLHALGNGVDGLNGLYRFGASSFPNESYRGSNYWVDVVFQPPTDGVPPVVSQVSASSVTPTQATITWTTNEWATSQVEYGTTTALGSATPDDSRLVSAHSMVLSNLMPGTTYRYRVRSRDAGGQLTVSPQFTFATLADTVAPTISNISSMVGSVGANIMWRTDEAADGRVEYGLTTSYGSTTSNETVSGTSHSRSLSNLLPQTLYHYRVVSRDPSGNTAVSADGTFTTATPRSCPCTIWNSTAAPINAWHNDPRAVELGMRFRADVNGLVTGVRFYKGTGNNGTHRGNLWSNTGQLLATVTFVNETASGWQQALFSTPVAVTADTTYVVSYHTSSGFAADLDYFDVLPGVDAPPLHALRNGLDGATGVFSYGASSFPTTSHRGSNYWVDVVFQYPPDTTAPVISGVAAQPTSRDATITWNTNELATGQVEYGLTTSLGSSTPDDQLFRLAHSTVLTNLLPGRTYRYRVRSRDLNGNVRTSSILSFFTPADTTPPIISDVAANAGGGTAVITWLTNEGSDTRVEYGLTTSYGSASPLDPVMRTSHSVTLTGLTQGALYHYRVLSRDQAGLLRTSGDFTFTMSSPRLCPCSLWSGTATPATPLHPDLQPWELGTRFRTDINGRITGVRFYKGAGNNGPHVGNLWTADGQLLATVTFTNETASGWQQALFSTPVQVTAGTDYVVSYFTTSGFALSFGDFLSAGVDNAPLHAPMSGVSTPNGVYRLGSSGFPQDTYLGSNYWVDVVFQP